MAEKLRAKEREQHAADTTNAAGTSIRSNCVTAVTDATADVEENSSGGWTRVTEAS